MAPPPPLPPTQKTLHSFFSGGKKRSAPPPPKSILETLRHGAVASRVTPRQESIPVDDGTTAVMGEERGTDTTVLVHVVDVSPTTDRAIPTTSTTAPTEDQVTVALPLAPPTTTTKRRRIVVDDDDDDDDDENAWDVNGGNDDDDDDDDGTVKKRETDDDALPNPSTVVTTQASKPVTRSRRTRHTASDNDKDDSFDLDEEEQDEVDVDDNTDPHEPYAKKPHSFFHRNKHSPATKTTITTPTSPAITAENDPTSSTTTIMEDPPPPSTGDDLAATILASTAITTSSRLVSSSFTTATGGPSSTSQKIWLTDQELLQQIRSGSTDTTTTTAAEVNSTAVTTTTTSKSAKKKDETITPIPPSSEACRAAWQQIGAMLVESPSTGETADVPHHPPSSRPSSVSSSSSSLDLMASLPYVILCDLFEQIEAISSRLQIQDLVTTLFRKIMLLQNLRERPQPGSSSSSLGNGPSTTTTVQPDAEGDLRRHPLYTVLYLCSNTVAPAYECVELGIGDALLQKAIGEACGMNPNQVKRQYETVGDLGKVAQQAKSKQRTLGGFFQKTPTPAGSTTSAPTTTNLSVQEVLSVFREIASTKGQQAQKWKVDRIKKLLVRASSGTETKYIIRGLQGKLRIGLAQSTVLIALAHALTLTNPATVVVHGPPVTKENEETTALPDEVQQYLDTTLPIEKRFEGAVNIVKKAYSEVPSYDALLDAALRVPLEELHHACTLQPGIPVAPMLAKPTKSIQEVLKRLNGLRFTCEYKYDGERAQVHMLADGTTKVFSRNLLDTTEKYPELPLFVKEAASQNSPAVQSVVLDTEVVAYNRQTGQLVPFQILSTRKKTEESADTAKVQVILQAFDLMYLNGESLLHRTLAERRVLLQQHFTVVPGKFQFATSLDSTEDGDTTVLEEFLDQAVKGQCEGLMVKTLDVNAIYEPSRRSLNWLKLKKDYLEGLGDSVDLVPLGAYHGKGKRTGVYGAYLLACYDADAEEFQSVCKIGTGFSDEDLQTLGECLNQHVIPTKSRQYQVSESLECDVWFEAVQVWEIKAADLSQSSAHRGAAGRVGGNGNGGGSLGNNADGAGIRGIGLRFPRFERIRPDKRPEEATTSDQILEMYYSQDTVAGGGEAGGDDEDDDYGI